MSRLLLCSVTLLLVSSCSVTKEAGKGSASSERMALGWIERTDFMSSAYPRFQEIYDSIQIEEPFLEMIRQLQSDIDVVVVLGTWCSDSKRQVPRFLKIVDLTGFPSSRIRFYGVDRTKKSNDGVTDQFRIELVPTFIFAKNGIEIGRIVETPRISIEEDMLVILADAQSK